MSTTCSAAEIAAAPAATALLRLCRAKLTCISSKILSPQEQAARCQAGERWFSIQDGHPIWRSARWRIFCPTY
jgi:uncharacterized protein YbaR (Trm112 family)